MNESGANEPVRILASEAGVRAIRRDLTRRRFLSIAAIAGSAAAIAACSPGGSTEGKQATGGDLEKSLSIYTWGEYDSPDVVANFTKELGPKVTLDSYGSNEELIAKLVAAKGTSGYDIVVPTGPYLPQMIENGLLMKFNKDLIPNMKNLDPAFMGRDWDPNNDYSVPKAWGTTGFVYDTTVIKRDLKTWADFIDAAKNEASGKTMILDDPAGLACLYFHANGIDWNTTDEAELEDFRTFAVEELAPHITAFDSYPSTAITQGSLVLGMAWNGEARLGLQEAKDPDRYQWVLGAPQTELWMDNMAIADGAPNPEAAHAYINYTLSESGLIDQLDYIGYHTGGAGIEDEAKARGVEMADLIFFDEEQVATMNTQEINESQQKRTDIFNEMKAAAGA